MHSITRCGQRTMAMNDTYGSDDSNLDGDEIKRKGQKKRTSEWKCKYGSTTHQRTNHSECLLNQKSGISSRKKMGVLILSMTEHLKMVMSFITLKIAGQMQKTLL